MTAKRGILTSCLASSIFKRIGLRTLYGMSPTSSRPKKGSIRIQAVEASLKPTFDVPCSRFFAQLGKRKGGHIGYGYRKDCDVGFSTRKRFGVDSIDLWSNYPYVGCVLRYVGENVSIMNTQPVMW